MRSPPAVSWRLLIIGLTTWSLVMVVPDLSRVAVPLASGGFAADNDGRIYDVRGSFAADTESPAWKAGLRVGDRLDLHAMRCTPGSTACGSLVAVLGGMGGLQLLRPGRVLTLTVIPATGEAERQVDVVAERVPRSWVSRAILLLVEITGIAFVLAATWLAWTRPGAMTLGFWFYALWFNPGQDFVAYLALQERPWLVFAHELLSAAVHGAACVGFLVFALRVPDDTSEPEWRGVTRVLPLVGLIVAALQLASNATVFGVQTEVTSRVSFFADLVVDAVAVWILFRRRHGHLPQDYQRLRWVIWGCLIGLPAYILSEILQSTSLWQTLSGSTAVPERLIGLLLLAYGILGWFVFEAVRRPRVVNVSIPLRRITVFGLILSVPALFAHQAIDHLREFVRLPNWAWIAVAALVLFLLGRLHELSAELADHVFNRTFRRQTAQLATVSREILHAHSADTIDLLLSEEPRDRLGLASAAVFRLDDGVFRRHVDGIGWTASTAITLDADDAALAGARTDKPFAIATADAERLALPAGLAAPMVAVPVRDRLSCRALAFYGPHASGADLARDEYAMLASLARDAGFAYGHVETEILRRRVAALELQLAALTP